MQITDLLNSTGTTGTNGTTSRLGRDEFLKLLVAQVQNQNPLEPMKDAEFMAQLAQFATVEGIDRLNASFEDMFRVQQLTQGASLVGQRITYQMPGNSAVQRGIVDSVSLHNGGLVLNVGGTQVPLALVRSVERPT